MLSDRLLRDPEELCRREAARYLGQIGTPRALELLLPGTRDDSAQVRASACAGLRDTEVEGALAVLLPLLTDDDLYVRRSASLAAISYGHEPAIPVLLESMKIRTLDTGENYGMNLFAELEAYVGEEIGGRNGLDLQKWLTWWSEHGEGFELQ